MKNIKDLMNHHEVKELFDQFEISEEQRESIANHASREDEIDLIGDEDIKAATNLVVIEALKTIKPLLEKLAEANEGVQNNQMVEPPQLRRNAETPQTGQTFEEQLENLQRAALERQKLQERRVAAKMKKMQSRFSNRD